MNAIWLSCSDIHMTKCASYNIPGQRKCCCYVLYWAAKSGVQKSCLTICDWWENSLFEALVLNQSSFLVGRWRKRCHLHFLLWLLLKYLNGWENANSIFPCCLKIVWENKYYSLHNFHILGHIMLFARNGWHDLTKLDALHVLLRKILIKIHKIQIYSNTQKRRKNNEVVWVCLLSSGDS